MGKIWFPILFSMNKCGISALRSPDTTQKIIWNSLMDSSTSVCTQHPPFAINQMQSNISDKCSNGIQDVRPEIDLTNTSRLAHHRTQGTFVSSACWSVSLCTVSRFWRFVVVIDHPPEVCPGPSFPGAYSQLSKPDVSSYFCWMNFETVKLSWIVWSRVE